MSGPPGTALPSEGDDGDRDDREPDPRALRVALAPSGADLGLPPVIVGPAMADGAARADRPDRADGPELDRVDDHRATLTLDGARHAVWFGRPAPAVDDPGSVRREVVIDGWRVDIEIGSARRAALRDRARRGADAVGHGGPTEVRAIIPGRVISVAVAAGEIVVAGQQLLVVEAMKMQNELRAPRDGTVARIGVGPGETLEIGDLLLVLE
jgi:biotin carboxyl carrier protein